MFAVFEGIAASEAEPSSRNIFNASTSSDLVTTSNTTTIFTTTSTSSTSTTSRTTVTNAALDQQQSDQVFTFRMSTTQFQQRLQGETFASEARELIGFLAPLVLALGIRESRV
jgi:hypothetical protein